jgi:hypothetical protein
MLVGFALMAFMDMVMETVLPGVLMVVDAFPGAVLMGMLVFVGVLVVMGMDMFVAMPPNPRMIVLMLVFMGVLMGMVMTVFVVALHGCLLLIHNNAFSLSAKTAWFFSVSHRKRDMPWPFSVAAHGITARTRPWLEHRPCLPFPAACLRIS